jgi:CRISPR-associated protein Csd1
VILQRLCEAAEQFDFPPFGYQEGPVKWIVDLDTAGRCLGFVMTTEGEGRGKGRDRGKRMLHPFVRRTSGVEAQFLADKATYALGLAGEGEAGRAAECSSAFRQLLRDALVECPAVEPVLRFLQDGLSEVDVPAELLPEDLVTFRVGGQVLIDTPTARSFWAARTALSRDERSSDLCTCTACGERRALANTSPIPIKPVPGGQTSGCALISANAKAFESYGRAGTLTSPICWDCAQRHAEVLNAMLGDPVYSFRLQDRLAYVFWTRQPTGFSASRALMNPDPDDVRRLLESPFKPVPGEVVEDDQLYALAISGSGGRVVIRDWFEATLVGVKQNLGRYFRAQAMASDNPSEDKPIGLYALMGALIPSKGKSPWNELPPGLIAEVVNAALRGGTLPVTLLQRAVNRARSEQGLTRPRAAIIKMCLLLPTHREEGFDVTPELSTQTQDPAYLCGRLLSILEGAQQAAVHGIKATLVDRYYGTASSAPASVFPNLMRLAQSHLAKLRKENPGAHTRLQEALENVAGGIGTEFPRTLTLIEQGKFALGYYQQRAADHAAAREAAAEKKARKGAAQTTDNDAQEGETDV